MVEDVDVLNVGKEKKNDGKGVRELRGFFPRTLMVRQSSRERASHAREVLGKV